MTGTRVYIAGMGIITSCGLGIAKTKAAIQKGLSGIRPLSLFSTAPNQPLPVGEVPGSIETDSVPRTHQLARLASDQAMSGCGKAPDAVVLGITTGGILSTEALLKKSVHDPKRYRYHAVGSVAEDIARRTKCVGPVITVSTACSSGTAAIKIALEMLRAGLVKRVLAGGADSLCRLTYYGFNSLQLVDPDGARPLDKNRRGMSVAEGAALLLLVSDRPDNAVAEVFGAGLSCDAHHPASPHPQGKGALAAMQAAIRDAGIVPADIDYINLHGTGTPDNDRSEAKAIQSLFLQKKPLLSSVKGAFGHSLAAAGAIEAVISSISVASQLVPANTGCRLPDPDLNLEPVVKPSRASIECVLSNSFGFGGNNAAVVIGTPGKFASFKLPAGIEPLKIYGCACLTGAGNTQATMENILRGSDCKGMLTLRQLSEHLSPGAVRRLKRLPRMALSLAAAAYKRCGLTDSPTSVFLGTGWGALSETYDFLTRLFETEGQFPSPTDFIGSVHNAPGGQIAMQFQSTGANITTSGGDYSFEQALMAAHLLSRDIRDSFFVIGVDESHPDLSFLFDSSVLADAILSDGGGAFCLKRRMDADGLTLKLAFYENVENNPAVISSLINHLGGPQQIHATCGAILAGIPGGFRSKAQAQLQTFLSLSGFKNPVIDYRKLVGEFASASAVAAAIAVKLLEVGKIPGLFCNGPSLQLNEKGVLVIGFGNFITAVEVMNR